MREEGILQEMEELLNGGHQATIKRTDEYGCNSLHYAAKLETRKAYGSASVLKWLLNNYTESSKEIINTKNKKGETPLDLAYEFHNHLVDKYPKEYMSYIDNCRLLKQNGGKANCYDKDGF